MRLGIIGLALGLIAMVAVLSLGFWPQFGRDLASADNPIVRVAVLPDEAQDVLRRRYAPLLDHLGSSTGLEFQLILPRSYDELVDMFGNGEVDLAYMGGYTFVQAKAAHGAKALVMRDVDLRFTSYFVSKTEGPLRHCRDLSCDSLRDKVLTFGSELSTSGHLMPRFYLSNELEMSPESYFNEVRYSGAHDATAYQVRDGLADVGSMNAEIFHSMRRSGRIKRDALRILWETPPYPDYVWAVQDGLSEARKTLLRDAFLALEIGLEVHHQILSSMGASAFLPARAEEYAALEQVIDSLRSNGSIPR